MSKPLSPRALVRLVALVGVGIVVVPIAVRADDRPDPGGGEGAYPLSPALDAGESSLSVGTVVERALAAAPTVEEARARARAAEAGIVETKAALWPRLALSGQYRRVDGFPDGRIDAGGGMQVTIEIPRDQTRFDAQLSVPVTDIFFRVLPLLRAAEGRRDVETFEAEAARSDVRATAEESYWRWVEARASVVVAEAAVAQAGEQRRQIEALARAGLATEVDVLAARSREAQAGETAATARGAYDVATRSLAVVGRFETDPRGFAVGSALDRHPTYPDEPADVLTARAFTDRAELRAVDAAIAAQGRRADATRSATLPRIEVFGGVQVGNPNSNVVPPIGEWNDSWEVGVRASWSPNDLAAGRAGFDREAADQAALVAQRDAIRDAVRLEVERALADWRAALGAFEAAGVREDAARETYDARRTQLAAGDVVITDLLQADLERTQAELSRLRASSSIHVAASDLRRAAGAP